MLSILRNVDVENLRWDATAMVDCRTGQLLNWIGRTCLLFVLYDVLRRCCAVVRIPGHPTCLPYCLSAVIG